MRGLLTLRQSKLHPGFLTSLTKPMFSLLHSFLTNLRCTSLRQDGRQYVINNVAGIALIEDTGLEIF
jgi:hypothetical protein